jgi:hypothetical protein
MGKDRVMRKQLGAEFIGQKARLLAARIMSCEALAGAVCPSAQTANITGTSTVDAGSVASGDTITFNAGACAYVLKDDLQQLPAILSGNQPRTISGEASGGTTPPPAESK